MNPMHSFHPAAVLAAFLAVLPSLAPAATSSAGAAALRCEHLADPTGIDEPKPCLGWVMTADRRGERQAAYQVLVAAKRSLLDQDRGDLWDSGKVASDESAHVEYAGAPLASGQQCFWKVRLWDKDGKETPWSQTAVWTMGLLQPGDWQAKWIEPAGPAPAGGPTKPFVLKRAVYAAADGAGSADVTARLAAAMSGGGLSVVVGNKELGGDPAYNHVKRLKVEYEVDGKAMVKEAAEGETITLPDGYQPPPPPSSLRYLRKSFTLDKPVVRATLYATALGLYEASLNGRRVGDIVLAPEWTEYGKRVRYQAYDVTRMVVRGPNALGAQIAPGWYSGHIGNGGFQAYGKTPAFLAQLEVEHDDGTTTRIVTDGSWRSHESPLLSSDFMLGENHDARLEMAGWNQPGLDEAGWGTVRERTIAPVPLQGQVTQPVRQLAEVKTVAVTEPKPGQWTFDLGQNMVGVVRLQVDEPAGTKITLRHAEMLNPDGTIYTANLRKAPSVDTYICRGGGPEIWQPKFTFHGFRYVEVTGTTKPPPPATVTGVVIGSDTPRAGHFSCSDPRLNQLQANIQWGQRGNYLSVPTDCPQRDERLGWMGDAQVFVRTATYNADVEAFFTKWLVDVDDSQGAEGAFSDVVPVAGFGLPGAPAWADAGVICPWTIYQAYGDKRLLARHFPAMVKWVEWCKTHSTGLIRDRDRGNDYGDWLSIGADTPKDVIATAYFAYSTSLVARAARALGRTAEADKYGQLFQDICEAYRKRYVAADGRIHGNTQCVYAMALKFGLLPEAMRARAAGYLEEDIRQRGTHISTGFVGVSYLLPMLAEAGMVDTAYGLLLQDTFPSWLFSVKHGATTIWERWDGWTPEKGFQNPGMNSFNHYAFGSCGEWLFEGVAGIVPDPEAPGFKRFTVRPRPGPGLASAQARFASIHGTIASEWKLADGWFDLTVVVPANTTATVRLPAKDPSAVTESGKAVASAEGVKALPPGEGEAVFEVGAGEYRFRCPAP